MPNVLSSPVGGLHWTKSSPILGVITMLPALSPAQTVSLSDGSRSAKSGLPHPMAKVDGIAARHEQDVRLPDTGHPALFVNGGQRGGLQHSQGHPP
jgi:hypothetical protein